MNIPNTEEQYLEGLWPVPTEEQMRILIEKVKKENPDLEKRELFNDTVKELLNPPHNKLVFFDGEEILISYINIYHPKWNPWMSFPLEEVLKTLGDKKLEEKDPRTKIVGPLRSHMVAIMKAKKNTETPK